MAEPMAAIYVRLAVVSGRCGVRTLTTLSVAGVEPQTKGFPSIPAGQGRTVAGNECVDCSGWGMGQFF